MDLRRRFAQRAGEIDAALAAAGRAPSEASYLPLVARKAEAWTVLLDSRSAAILGYLPLDSF